MDTKPWYESLTVWGAAILTLCGLVLPAVGVVDFADFLKEENVNITDILAAAGGVIGLIMNLIGRFRARTKLTIK
jgi:presenilin-like A22 family membrane protease